MTKQEILDRFKDINEAYNDSSRYDSLSRMIDELLKEQEAVEPKISESYRTNSGRMSRRKAWCGACGIGINMDAKFCDHCGRQVKWE